MIEKHESSGSHDREIGLCCIFREKMSTRIHLLCLSLMLLSCGKRPPRIDYESLSAQDTLSMENLINDTTKTVVAGLPVVFDSVRFLIHPVGLIELNERSAKALLKSGSYSSSVYAGSEFDVSSSEEDGFVGNMTNLVFESVKSREQRLLTNKVINIMTVIFLRDVYAKTNRQYLLYTIIDKDTNQDRLLDNDDIESLYVSNTDGTGFKKMTKDQHEYYGGELIKEELKFYFKTIEDANHDGQFDRMDSFHYYYLDFSKDTVGIFEYNPLRLLVQ